MSTVDALRAAAYTVPTDAPEADGTLAWDSTTIVVVHAEGGGITGLGFTYADPAAAALITGKLAPVVQGADAAAPRAAWQAMVHAVRNLGRPGLAATAISAVDLALWDLHARLLGAPLATVLGLAHDRLPVYGSGGFTTYGDAQLAAQLGGWVAEGIPQVKMKIGGPVEEELHRVGVAREAIGPGTALMVDANGAYTRKQALAVAERLHAAADITWFEEPVSSDDREGLRLLRDRAPAPVQVAAGEYAWSVRDLRRLLEAGAVDVLQADVTRCGGVTELLRAGALCEAYGLPLSCHCAPAMHVHPACAVGRLLHGEYFHDHVRIERMLFDGAPELRDGALWPDLTRPGNGLALREEEAAAYAA